MCVCVCARARIYIYICMFQCMSQVSTGPLHVHGQMKATGDTMRPLPPVRSVVKLPDLPEAGLDSPYTRLDSPYACKEKAEELPDARSEMPLALIEYQSRIRCEALERFGWRSRGGAAAGTRDTSMLGWFPLA